MRWDLLEAAMTLALAAALLGSVFSCAGGCRTTEQYDEQQEVHVETVH